MRKTLLLLGICIAFNAFTQEEARRITKTLCSEEFHGRGYVNSGDSLAAVFISEEFKKIGVKPLAESYFQYFTFPVNSFPGDMEVVYNDRKLTPDEHYIVDPASSPYKGTLTPYTVKVDQLVDQDELGATLRRIIDDPAYNSILLDLIRVGSDTLKELQGIEQVLGNLMPVISLKDSKFNWSVGREQLKNPIIYLQDSVYSTEGNFKLDIDATFIPQHRSQNVVAYLPAKLKCRKTIVFSAHYDHLGQMGKDIYFPGANDNASGTAMLLSMARYFKENPSKYNIMFIAFAGEEAGLLGSKYYTEHPMQKLKKIKFLVNLDIMGSGEDGITVVNATLFKKQFELLQKINEDKNLLKEVKSRGPAANSDHYWFTEKGVPAFFIYTMGPNKHYHDIYDTYEELTFNEYEDIITLLTTFVRDL